MTLAEELERLAGKYARMVALAVERERAAAAGGFEAEAGVARRRAFRELSRDFPGALRELEALSAAALRERAAAVDEELAAVRGGRTELGREWIRVVLALHAELRLLLAARQAGARTGPLLDEVAARLGISRGRLVAIAFGAVSSGCG